MNIFELSFVGSPGGLMRYIRSFLPNCEICEDRGFIQKTEWSGTDDSYDVEVKCQCQED